MPALLMRMSMAPNRSSVAATAAWRISGTVRSPGVTIAPGPPAARSFSGERAISESRAPRFRKAAAQAAPIPSEAPVMRTTFPSMRIDGKVVLIPGASEGIGAACAAAFRKRGARLSLIARSPEKLRAAGGPGAIVTPGDLTVPEIRQAAVAATLDRFGAIDILINNAGMGLYDPAWSAPLSDARSLFELDFFAPLAL